MAKARVIKYLPKHTQAGTEYREIDEDDKQLILNTCIHILSKMAEFDRSRNTDDIWVRDQWWHKRTDKLHKSKTGPNSPCSVIGGIVYNMMYKDPQQRDLSAKQMEDLETITNSMASVFDDIEPFRFQIGLS